MDESHEGPSVGPSPGAEEQATGLARSGGGGECHQRIPFPPAGSTPVVESRDRDGVESASGRVYLVGAGPGDPDLLTRRAWDVLGSADAVLYDSLTGEGLLAELPRGVTAVDVGKRPPDPVSQDEIHDRLSSRARAGESVVRLKGGDPNVFGRGGEEAEHLAAESIPFEVVPGVSSVVAAPSVAGIPLTHRDHASSVTVVTGREAPEKEESALDWASLAGTVTTGGTLVVLMGVASLPAYVARLREEGIPVETPVAIVEKATWEGERTLTTTLGDAAADARAADIQPPAVTIIGDVVGIRDRVSASRCRE